MTGHTGGRESRVTRPPHERAAAALDEGRVLVRRRVPKVDDGSGDWPHPPDRVRLPPDAAPPISPPARAKASPVRKLRLAQFRPALAMNADLLARYSANRLRVVRQLRYSLKNQNCIDVVLFLNGIPVATAELKTDF